MTPDDPTRDPRTVEAEIEVPGTPEQVWDAIATGPGITAWFVPTESDERPGGVITQHHGEGLDMEGEITAWDAPRRFAYAMEWAPTEDASRERIGAEFLVEARSGDTCIVRVVNSGFGSGPDWDRMLESTRAGWRNALDNLRLYLTHFPGHRGASFAASGLSAESRDEAWATLTEALGMRDARVGDEVSTPPDAPTLAGVVVRAEEAQLGLRLDQPGPGLASLGTGGPGREVIAFVRAYLYSDDAPALAARAEEEWQTWLAERFSAAAA
jgi:uncharacterized protein YndB with AHSA1/START domain